MRDGVNTSQEVGVGSYLLGTILIINKQEKCILRNNFEFVKRIQTDMLH